MTTPTKISGRRVPLGRAGAAVDERAARLQARYLAGDPSAVAALARLRRGVGQDTGASLDILEFTVLDVPERDQTADPTHGENAVHVAMTLFALHQQSGGARMHVASRGVGTALRALHQGTGPIPEPIQRRFRVLGTSDSFPEVTHHLRGAVQLLRGAGIPLDYGRLADQLVRWQQSHGNEVRLQWGREFYRTDRPAKDADADTPATDSATDTEPA